MRIRRNNLFRLIYLLFFILIFSRIGAFASWGGKDSVLRFLSYSDRKSAGTQIVSNVIDLLKNEYIGEIDANRLLTSAIDGMEKYLKQKKMSVEGLENNIKSESSFNDNLNAFADTFEKVLLANEESLTENDLTYAALSGIVEALQKANNDPYTVVLDQQEFKELKEQLSSEGFSGIGIVLELDKNNNNALMVVEPMEGSPAEEAGLKAGDYILDINGFSTRGLSLDAAAKRIRGPVNTPVILQIKRKNQEPFRVTVNRRIIHTTSLSHRMYDNVGYIRLRFFGETTEDEFRVALEKLKKEGARGLILDLRNNGGGYIISAVRVCSNFLSPDTLVTSVVNYRNQTREDHTAYGNGNIRLPLVILINEFSASASEITAGCLQDTGTGVLIGQKSFGKGSVQTLYQIPGVGAIKYTSAHYLTPKGRDIDHLGIEPDIEVKMDSALIGTPEDVQMKKALTYLKSKISKY